MELHQKGDKFVSEGNPIISATKNMSDHMTQLVEYTRGSDCIVVCIY